MIISTNKSLFVNPTTASYGTLRTYGTPFTSANEAFMAFKPATVYKGGGFLSIKGVGYLFPQLANTTITMMIEFSKPGVRNFTVPVLYSSTAGYSQQTDAGFTFQVDIPVGTTGPSLPNHTFVTAICRGTTSLFEAGTAYITADPDDIWCAAFKYTHSNSNGEVPVNGIGEIQIFSIIAEYKEN